MSPIISALKPHIIRQAVVCKPTPPPPLTQSPEVEQSVTPLPEQCAQEERSSVSITACLPSRLTPLSEIHPYFEAADFRLKFH